MTVTLNINGRDHRLDLQGHETLLEVLRHHLGLTGTKTACEESECGTCTVHVDGVSVLSCITLAAACEGKRITSIEGLAQGDRLHPLQETFLHHGAAQCGFCIPGMIMAAKNLLDENPQPTLEEIQQALDGNICRCAGYPKIFEAIREAGRMLLEQNQASHNENNTGGGSPETLSAHKEAR